MRGGIARLERERARDAWLAWHTAYLPSAKRPPRSPGDLIPKAPQKRQSALEMMSTARAWHHAIRKTNGISGRNTPG